MPKFKIKYSETVTKIYIVEAEDQDAAYDLDHYDVTHDGTLDYEEPYSHERLDVDEIIEPEDK